MEGNTVNAAFIKVRDILTPLAEYDMCLAVATQVGHNNVLGCQKIRGLWRVYLLDEGARVKLITEQLTVNNQTVSVYGDSPFRAGIDSLDDEVTRITTKDLPISFGNDDIKRYMEAKSVKVRRIDYAKARNPITKELSKFYNGDRLLFVDKLETLLPRSDEIVGQKIRIYHDGQVTQPKNMLCARCLATDHTKAKCRKSDPWCFMCESSEHKAGAVSCESTTDSPSAEV